MEIKGIEPEGWDRPSGYSNGMLVSGAGRLLFLAGQVAWDGQKQLVGGDDFAAQFRGRGPIKVAKSGPQLFDEESAMRVLAPVTSSGPGR